MSHFCEFDAHTNGMLSPCGLPAVAKWRGKWYCEPHLESMEARAGLMDDLKALEQKCDDDGDLLDEITKP